MSGDDLTMHSCFAQQKIRAGGLITIFFIAIGTLSILIFPITASAQTTENCAQGIVCSSISSITEGCRTGGTCNLAERNVILRQLGGTCDASPSPCSPEDLALLAKARGEYERQDQEKEIQKRTAETGSCSISIFGTDWNCVWKAIASWAGSWFLSIGGTVLLIAGTLFDWLLNLLVIGFADTIQDLRILDGVQTAWTLFRDIANIAIIGIFVFVAIMTILGSGEYGAKRLVARVLIVAILINFSLLFTRLIVESTNFMSSQFARAMPGFTAERGPDTAQAFLKTFGMQDVWNESSRITEKVAQSTDSGRAAFFYGLVGGIVLLAIAAVLFYGAFVITARALLLIFAMLTSAIAFASFLLPNTAQQPFIGWSAWWSNLLRAALFGPILMLFLWVTITIIDNAKVQAGGAGKAIGTLADNPAAASTEAWGSIALLLLSTGMLFIAIRAAGSFASTIGGFNMAGGLPLAISSRLAGVLGRNTLGWGATAMFRRNERALAEAKLTAAKTEADFMAGRAGTTRGDVMRAQRALNNLVKDSSVYDKISKSTFNAANTRIGKELAKTLGVAGLAGGKAESYGARAERLAKEAAKKGEKFALGEGQKKELSEREERLMTQQRDAAQKQLTAAEKSLEATRAGGEHQSHVDAQREAQKQIEKITSSAKEEIKNMGRAGASQSEIQKRIAERDSALKEQQHKIDEAHKAITSLERDALRRAGVDEKVQQTARLSDKEISKAAKANINAMSDAAAQEAAARYIAGTFGSTKGVIPDIARDMVKKSKKEHDEGHHILHALKKQLEHGDDHGGGGGDQKKDH